MQPLSGNQRPDLLTALMNISCTAPATENASLQILFKCPTPAIVCGNATKPSLTRSTIPCACHAKRHLNVQKCLEHVVLLRFWLRNVLRATTASTFSTSQLPRVVRSWCALYILTSKCASRHNSVHFLDISISKSGPRMVYFVHFDFEMCFAPQRRAPFRHLNFQSGGEVRCFVHFDLEMCFAPQRRAIFHLSSGQLAPHPPL